MNIFPCVDGKHSLLKTAQTF